MSRCQRRTIYRPSLLHASSLLQPETRFSPQPLVLILASASKHLPWADGPRVRQPCFHLRLCKQCLAQPVSIELGFKHGCISPKCLWCMFRSLLSEGHRDDPGGAPGKQRKRETEESQMDPQVMPSKAVKCFLFWKSFVIVNSLNPHHTPRGTSINR